MGIDYGYGIGSVKPGVCTSTTKPASPYDGQVIYMTDVDQTAVWEGSQWTVLSPIAGGRNLVINGGLDIWQRGTSFTNPASATGFTADRFFPVYDGSGATRTISQGQFDPYLSGASITASPPSGLTPTYFLRWNQSVAGTGASYNILYVNRIENVRVIAGRQVTLSFYAKASANLTMPKIDIEQSFGTGGSPSASVYTDVTSNIAVTTAWQRFTYTFTVPSAAGKVIGTGINTSYTSIRLWLPINATFVYDIWGVQLEFGAVATPFEFEDIGITIAKCQRYYQKSYQLTVAPGSATTEGLWYQTTTSNAVNDFVFRIEPRVEMRTMPTANVWDINGVSGNWSYTRSGVGVTSVPLGLVYHGTSGFCLYGGVGAAYVACQAYGFYSLSAEL